MRFTYALKQLFYRVVDSSRAFKEEGIRAGLLELVRIGGRICYQRAEYVVLAKSLSENASPTMSQPGLVIRRVTTREEIANLGSIASSPDLARFYQLFDCGCVPFVASQNDRTVGYCWISKQVNQGVDRVGAALSLRPGDVYMHDLFTSPVDRGKGFGGALAANCLGYAREQDYRRAFVAMAKDNVPSLRVMRKTGYRAVGALTHSRILFWDHFKYSVANHD